MATPIYLFKELISFKFKYIDLSFFIVGEFQFLDDRPIKEYRYLKPIIIPVPTIDKS